MLKCCVATALVMGLIVSGAAAEVIIVFDPTEGIMAGQPTDIQVSLTPNPQAHDDTIGAVILDFGTGTDLAEINPTEFVFDDALTGPNWWWMVDMPYVVQSSFMGMEPEVFLVDGELTNVGVLTVEPPADTPYGWYTLASNALISDAVNFEQYIVKGGDPTELEIIPEPASLCLLAFGALALVRRRR